MWGVTSQPIRHSDKFWREICSNEVFTAPCTGREQLISSNAASLTQISDPYSGVFNRPFAGSSHMVQNKLHWDANDAVGLPKQRNSYQSSSTFFCFGSPTASFASQCNLFGTMWPDPAKGLLSVKQRYSRDAFFSDFYYPWNVNLGIILLDSWPEGFAWLVENSNY